jgi:chaperonin GroEL
MQIVKKQIHGKEAREKMEAGIDKLADVVGSTMGARGRNVVLDKEYGAPLVVNDGVTIANEIFFEDQLANLSAQLIKDAARRTNFMAGDGTTGSIVLSRAIVKQGWQKVEEGANPVLLRKELDKARDKIEADLKESSEKITKEEQAIQIAQVSVQDKDLGEKIGKLMFDVGANGAVAIKNSVERGVFIDKAAGMRLEGSLVGGVIGNQDKWETKYEACRVLILRDSPEDHEFETKWIPLMKQFVDGQQLPNGQMQINKVNVPHLVVVAEKLSRRFIMAMNQNKEVVRWVWFRPTTAEKNMKEIYEDLRCMVGGQTVFEEDGVYLNKMQLTDLGRAETATIARHELVVTVQPDQLNGDRFLNRVADVKGQIENADDEIEKEQIKERYANLTGGVATIRVAAATDQDTIELKLRIEDAINATRSAMDEGYLPGGGVALLNSSNDLGGTHGEDILKEACKAPITQILHNAGYEDKDIEKILNKLKTGEGVNVIDNSIVDMKQAGVVDPLRVIRLSLIHAVSVAGLLLTSEYVVVDEKETDVEAMKRILVGNK